MLFVWIGTLISVVQGLFRLSTLTEISEQVFTNITMKQQPSSCAPCALTLFTSPLIGSYRFCIIPLLSAFYGKPKTQLWRNLLKIFHQVSVVILLFAVKSPLLLWHFIQ
uniref:Uncharacterized protein n=1 Tax=Cyprinus carpio TaxID=7962 RepID=A0A8C1JLJ0_CYPCA